MPLLERIPKRRSLGLAFSYTTSMQIPHTMSLLRWTAKESSMSFSASRTRPSEQLRAASQPAQETGIIFQQPQLRLGQLFTEQDIQADIPGQESMACPKCWGSSVTATGWHRAGNGCNGAWHSFCCPHGNANLFYQPTGSAKLECYSQQQTSFKTQTLPRVADGEAQDNIHLQALASSGATQRLRTPGKKAAGEKLSTLLQHSSWDTDELDCLCTMAAAVFNKSILHLYLFHCCLVNPICLIEPFDLQKLRGKPKRREH
ncbi:hypothetical protein EK904_012880 [Melospiza melodia maxima]|nr:hypothetical protein EK904_012880 [Melospiza melodia maxima]